MIIDFQKKKNEKEISTEDIVNAIQELNLDRIIIIGEKDGILHYGWDYFDKYELLGIIEIAKTKILNGDGE